jgi:hypothetical protein
LCTSGDEVDVSLTRQEAPRRLHFSMFAADQSCTMFSHELDVSPDAKA